MHSNYNLSLKEIIVKNPDIFGRILLEVIWKILWGIRVGFILLDFSERGHMLLEIHQK